MRPRALADFRVLATASLGRRAALVAALALLERTLTPFLAWTLVQRTVREQIVFSLAFGAVFTVRNLVQRVVLARSEAELLERAAASVLAGDVLRADLPADQDIHLEASQAVYQTATVFSQTLPNLAADVAACVVLAVVVAWFEPAGLVAVAAAFTVLAAAALLISRRAVAGAVERAWSVKQRVYELFGDALEGRLEIVASGRRAAFMADFGRRTREWARAGVRVAGAAVLSGRLALAAVAGLVAAALFANGEVRSSLAVSLTDLALFASVTPAFAGVAQGVHAYARDERWLLLLARVVSGAKPAPHVAGRAAPALPARVAFEDVSFRYDTDAGPREALSGVDFAWDGRGVLALVGANGSGKSTCLRLLLALAPPIAGAVTIAGTPLADLDPDAWRARVAFLPQRPYLPPRSDVRQAVRWPLSETSDGRILQALDRVGLLPVLRRAGSDPLEVRVDSLSVGQRQRVALARLLCRDAELFLLDEPDANLDRAGIALVAELLRKLAGKGMVAFAAHTPELVAAADRVVTLDAGRVGGTS
jgi:ABC-type transport system involved in cytochrome bd biosynthesis fused ATPase/permease subunit